MSERYPFKWTDEAKEYFERIKSSVANAPTLINPDFKKDFVIYCYASEHTMSGILLQEDESGIEAPIAFMSVPLKKHELKDSLSEKQAFAMVKVVKQFRYYILHSHSVIFVLDSTVKSILTQQEVKLNKRVMWVTKIQEYDLDIHPTKTVKGQGLCKLMAKNKMETKKEPPLTLFIGLQDTWFSDVAYYLTYGSFPSHLSAKEQRNLKLKAAKYVIWQDVLYKKGLDGTYLRCVDKPQQQKLLEVYHGEACGGYFSSSGTAFKI